MTGELHFKRERVVDVSPFFDAALDLYKVPRTGWVKRGVSEDKVESVGEHTASMTEIFNNVIDKIDPEKKLDRKKMLKMIQVHDWAESVAGDQIVHSSDVQIENKLKAQKSVDENEAVESICAKLGKQGEKILNLWREQEANQTSEAQIVKQIDKLQAVIKAYEYELAGEPVLAQEFIDGEKQKNRIIHPVLFEIMTEIENKCKK